MTASQQHSLDIACPVDAFYAYVTQPWRWHEWHPSSRSARAAVDVLRAGKLPFLHVAYSNARAKALYEAMGYRLRRDIPFMALRRNL